MTGDGIPALVDPGLYDPRLFDPRLLDIGHHTTHVDMTFKRLFGRRAGQEADA